MVTLINIDVKYHKKAFSFVPKSIVGIGIVPHERSRNEKNATLIYFGRIYRVSH